MAKFNQSNTGINKTVNKCGVTAYKMQDKEKLATMVLTTLFNENKYYGDNSKELLETASDVIKNGGADFVSKLAMYARNEMNLRSVSHALAALLAKEVNGKAYVRSTIKSIVKRADDITEILACYLNTYGKPIPNSLKKALNDAMNQMDEYGFAKYDKESAQVKFADVLMLCHSKAKTQQQNALFKKILSGELETAYTWESELSANGNNTETWERLIDSGKVGYMALLRNLRNIINACPRNINKVYDKIQDRNAVLKSKQLPFRFYSAYKELSGNASATSKVFDALETAIEHSTENIEKFKGVSLIAVDVSGSMTSVISSKSTVLCSDIACLLAAMANKICEEAIVVAFDTNIKSIAMSTRNGIIANAKSIDVRGGGTDITLPFTYLIQNRKKVDRIILLSDNEINHHWNKANYWYGSAPCQRIANEYRKINPDVWIHAIDLQGYGTQQFAGKNTNIIAGWSERVFEFIHIAEKGIGNLVKVISEYGE